MLRPDTLLRANTTCLTIIFGASEPAVMEGLLLETDHLRDWVSVLMQAILERR